MTLQGSYKFDPEAPENVYYWDVRYPNSEDWEEGNAEEHTGEIIGNFCRASKQYDSTLLNSSQGCGWKVLTYAGANGQDAKVIKVYKPSGMSGIILHGSYTDSSMQEHETKVEMDFTNKAFLTPSCMVITLVFGSGSSMPEIYEHTSSDSVALISQFKERSHEMQINGSNFCVSIQDYLDPSKESINGYQVRAIPNYCNIAMTRTFQKFFIGGYRNAN